MISRILVANRGEIARRIFRTCRALGITTVAVYSEADNDEPHALEADAGYLLTGSTAAETYLNIDALVAVARESGADAVHPGYGFLAENPSFARAVEDAGVIWIGPSVESMEIMGSKLESKRLMKSIGVPTLESVELDGGVDPIEAAERIGFPVLVKASAGGGGKGMRVVDGVPDLPDAIEGARREAAGAFGDDRLFLERYLQEPRHIEIQVFGDGQGKVVSLHERECSIQRRHQKIVEESPSPALDAPIREAMSRAAISAARAVDYRGAGTVEFLFQDGAFYFLEMNTRLQVEHPVTEMVTGLDLVRMQIEVANGDPLPDTAPPIEGHAVEVRLYAEDPLNDYLPVTGRVHLFEFEDSEGVRVDSGVESGSVISVHYDPLIAKVIAHGNTRQEAASLLARSLRRARLHAPTTNRALLVRILESEEFLSGHTDTHFLRRHDLQKMARPLADSRDERIAAIACALADQAHDRSESPVLASIPSGWRNSPSQLQMRTYTAHHGTHPVSYSASGAFLDEIVGEVVPIETKPTSVILAIDGDQHELRIARYGNLRYVHSEDVPAALFEVPRYPTSHREGATGSLQAPMPGRVVRVAVSEGDVVSENQVLVILEAMKMEHALRAPHAGTVAAVLHHADEQVEAGSVLVVVETSD